MAAKAPRQIPILPSVGGMNNVRPPSHAVFQPRPVAGGGLAPPEAVTLIRDMDLDSDGAITTRAGAVTVLALTAGRRLIAKGGMVLVQDGTDLQLVNLAATPSPTATTLVAGLSASARLLAHEWPVGGDQVLVTDSILCRRVRAGAVGPWGFATPAAPTITVIGGALPAAGYLVTAALRDGAATSADAMEGGTKAPARQVLTDPGGLFLSLTVTDPLATHVAFYVSGPDQEQPFLVAVVAIVTVTGPPATRVASLTLTALSQIGLTKIPPFTPGWGPPPAGITAMGSMEAYMLVAVGNVVYRSWPGLPWLFNPAFALQAFPGAVTAIVGLPGGAYVGTVTGLYWLAGGDPINWDRQRVGLDPVIPDGLLIDGAAIPGLQFPGPVALFVTPNGLIAGLPGGQVRRLTYDRYHFPAATRVSIVHRPAARHIAIAVTEP